ncbi:MAG: hypothetical protein M3406_07260 [Chloroflexota bacterium]|nr:hypothetical protein [Chloroflexota bacterium]
MIDRTADPRTEDTIEYDLLRTPRGATEPEAIGRATFRGGHAVVDAPEGVRIAVEELLSRGFVDRIQADERPRGYRRSGSGMVDMLVPGMPEHFIARLRGLWLSYPDGSVVTARPGSGVSTREVVAEPSDTGTSVTDARVRRSTLVSADRRLGTRPLVRAHAPEEGLRPESELASSQVNRTDCGWIT